MKKVFLSAILVLCFLGCFSAASADNTLTYQVGDWNDPAIAQFVKDHPDVEFIQPPNNNYETTSQLAGALLTHEYKPDVSRLDTGKFNIRQIISKGFFCSLSDSKVIMDILNQMHPSIAKQVYHDGEVYAVPYSIGFSIIQVDDEGWEAAGLTDDDVPSTFTELLDFLENWCDRIEDEPELDIRVSSSWDYDAYGPYHYTYWLTKRLIDSYIQQCQFDEQELRFIDTTLQNLLERVSDIGSRIYALEPAQDTFATGVSQQLFTTISGRRWPSHPAHIVSLRLAENQPRLITAYVNVFVVNRNTTSPKLCIELIEDLMENIIADDAVFLYQDAEPLEIIGFTGFVEKNEAEISQANEKLLSSNLSITERSELEIQLEELLAWRQELEEIRYIMSPEQLSSYQSYVDSLYFPEPNVFSGGDGYDTLDSLMWQFASGVLTAKQFLDELDRVAWMMEMENQ